MADTANYDSYKESGFQQASGVAGLQEQVSKVPASDDALRQQAVEQYAPTYEKLDKSLTNQLTALITSQATDEKLLNQQYNNSVSSMMAQLQKRGLHVSPALVGAQNAALNKHRNEVTAMRQKLYVSQMRVPAQQKVQLRQNYEQAIAQRVAANRQTSTATITDLLAQIADLQGASFADYLEFFINKKNAEKSSSSGSSSRKSSSSPAPTQQNNSYVNTDTLKGSGKTTYTPVVTSYYTTADGKKIPIVTNYYKSTK